MQSVAVDRVLGPAHLLAPACAVDTVRSMPEPTSSMSVRGEPITLAELVERRRRWARTLHGEQDRGSTSGVLTDSGAVLLIQGVRVAEPSSGT
jgi:hypothetical protein